MTVDLDRARTLIRERSPLDEDRTEQIILKRFAAIPNRLRFALERWPLAAASVLDVGCSFGHCLVHFGPGSVGIDNNPEHVEFCRALGLDARLADADGSLDAVPDSAFEYIWVSDLLEHLDSPRLAIRRLATKLNPSGRLLLYLTALPRSRLARAILRRRAGAAPFEAGTHYYQFTLETAHFVLERAGFRVETVAVPLLRGKLERLGAVVRPHAPTLILEGRRDEAAEHVLLIAEAKNKPADHEATL
jgi:SAM-dependent methyltransferase